MTSYFPYYLALFGLLFFISVICCCIKLIDIIDRPVQRPSNTMPSWNYASYLQGSPVAILSPQQTTDPFRCGGGESSGGHSNTLPTPEGPHYWGLTMEEYISATGTGSNSRDAITQGYGNSLTNSQNNHNSNRNNPSLPTPSPTKNPPPPASPPSNVYRIPVPDYAVQPTLSPAKAAAAQKARQQAFISSQHHHQSYSSTSYYQQQQREAAQRQRQHQREIRDRESFRQSSLRERDLKEFRERERERERVLRPSRSRCSLRERGGGDRDRDYDVCFDV